MHRTQRSRRGWTLAQVSAVVFCATIVFAMLAMCLSLLRQAHHGLLERLETERQWRRLAFQLRSDCHRASDATWDEAAESSGPEPSKQRDPNAAPNRSFRLTDAEGDTTYTLEAERLVRREQRDGETWVELFPIRESTTVSWRKSGRLFVLELRRSESKTGRVVLVSALGRFPSVRHRSIRP